MQPINTVIIIDDDPVHIFLSRKQLLANRPDLKVIDFTSAIEGLMYIANEPVYEPAIILLDMNMPFMNGWDFLNEFDALPAEVKSMFVIYMVSSSVDQEERERAEQNPNITAFYCKPITRNFLSRLPVARTKTEGLLVFGMS